MNKETDICANYHGGNEESYQAHAKTNAAVDRLRILQAVKAAPEGLTCDELELLLNMRHQTCSARCSELKAKGFLMTHGVRSTRSGCSAAVLTIARLEQLA